MAVSLTVDCAKCSFPNPAWRRRCDRCDDPLHPIGTHLAVWGLGTIVLATVALILLAPR